MRSAGVALVIVCLLGGALGCKTLRRDVGALGRRPSTPEPWLSGREDREAFAALFRAKWEEREKRRAEEEAEQEAAEAAEAADGQSPGLEFSGPASLRLQPEQTYEWSIAGTDLEHSSNAVVRVSEEDGRTVFRVDAAALAGLDTLELRAWRGSWLEATGRTGAYAELYVGLRRAGEITGTFQLLDDLDAEKYFGTTFAQSFFCIRVRIANSYEHPVRVDAGSIELMVYYVSRETPGQGAPEPPSDPDTMLIEYEEVLYQVWPQPRVPMNFTAVINTIRFDERHDSRSVVLGLLRSAGVIAAGAAGFGGVGDSYGEVVSFVQGPIQAQLEALLLADLVQNLAFINEHALHESIIIPARDGVEKYVFFPRGDITGIWSLELPVRVMYLEESLHDLEGSVITSEAEASTSTPAP